MLNQSVEIPICGRCKQAITDICYAQVEASLIMQAYIGKEPQIFYSKESAENYSQKIPMHADCWIDTLRDHGIPLHDMKAVFEKMQREAIAKKGTEPQKKKKGKK